MLCMRNFLKVWERKHWGYCVTCAVLPVTQLTDMDRRILFLMFVVVQRESHTKKNIVLISGAIMDHWLCVRTIIQSHVQYIIITPYPIACLRQKAAQ